MRRLGVVLLSTVVVLLGFAGPATPGGPNTFDTAGNFVADVAWSVDAPWVP